MLNHHWTRNFKVDGSDVDYLTNLLLDRETPLSTRELALALIGARLEQSMTEFNERFKDVRVYNPAHTYAAGERLIFTKMNYQTGVVVDKRAGDNPDYGDFTVISVKFEGKSTSQRQFAADLKTEHVLNDEGENGSVLIPDNPLTAEEVLQANEQEISDTLDAALKNAGSLVRLSNKWFLRDLLLDVNIGYLNLAEAVLDMVGGGPLPPERILDEIGGLGDYPQELQIFSLNYALNEDSRFDEVGPAGEVLWYLTRLEPPEVLDKPALLRYAPVIDYDRSLLSPEMLALELEIGDELSPLPALEQVREAVFLLTYPHRRVGTLPLNYQTKAIFPTARRAPRIWVTLVDGQDGEEFTGWVVHNEGYVFGLSMFYQKHKLPVGVYLKVRLAESPEKFVVDFTAHRPRSEWLRVILPQNGQVNFENIKRSIGAAYDDLMILGVEDLQAVDALTHTIEQQRRSLAWLMKALIPALGRLSPQGTVHAKTLYSALNVLRRCPPGPMLAMLANNPDFMDLGEHYWKLSE